MTGSDRVAPQHRDLPTGAPHGVPQGAPRRGDVLGAAELWRYAVELFLMLVGLQQIAHLGWSLVRGRGLQAGGDELLQWVGVSVILTLLRWRQRRREGTR